MRLGVLVGAVAGIVVGGVGALILGMSDPSNPISGEATLTDEELRQLHPGG